MNKLAFILLGALLLFGKLAWGQKLNYNDNMAGNTLKQIVKSAEEAMEVKDYYTAMQRYKRAREIKPKEISYAYGYAQAARLVMSYARAEEAYADVLAMREPDAYPLTRFWLANTKQLLGKYNEAIQLYEEFIAAQEGNEEVASFYLQRARKEIVDSGWARDLAAEPHNVEVEHLNDDINTPNKEFGVFVIGDTLFYSSLSFESRKDNEPTERAYSRILYSVNGEKGIQLGGEVNDTTRHTANLAYNGDKTMKVFTRCDYLGDRSVAVRCRIYMQKVDENGNWTTPMPIASRIQKEGYTYTHPSIGKHTDSGKEYLYYVSDEQVEGEEDADNDGDLDLDIWVVELLENGDFGVPEKFDEVNTDLNDVTPFFHNRSQTFYYSSEGQKEIDGEERKRGLGGLDIYKMKRKDGEWMKAENMGKPINSSLNDVAFTLNDSGERGYFASNRLGSNYLDKEFELCCDDIYAANFDVKVELLVNTFNQSSMQALEGVTIRLLEMKEDGNITEVSVLTNPESNDFAFYVDRGKKYMLEANRPGFVQQMEEMAIDIDAPDQLQKDIFLNPLIVDLQALTYDMDTELPLSGVTVQVIEVMPDGSEEVVQEQFNDFGNDFKFPLELDKVYVIRATKSGYQPLEELQLSTKDLAQPESFLAELYLKRTSFGDYLPMEIYFDNDFPDQNSTSRTTNTDYSETVTNYVERQDEYISFYTEPMDQEEAYLMAERYDDFFSREVEQGYETLKEFAAVLKPFLERGNEITLHLEGYASPRAESQYNYNLSSRRIVSVENFFRSYEGGVLLPYIEQGSLNFQRSPYGEARTNYFKDLLEDERDSIFSLGASLERRVEIKEVEVRLNDDDSRVKSFSSKGSSEE